MDFHTKVVGVTFENRQRYIRRMSEGEYVTLERDPMNPYDPNAIKVVNKAGYQIGYISRELAEKIAYRMDSGVRYTTGVIGITGNNPGERLGVNLLVHCDD